MGQSSFSKSTRSDVVSNVQYALNELMLWRERGEQEGCSDEKSRGRPFGKYSDTTTTSGSGGSGVSDVSSSSSDTSGSGSGMASAVGSTSAAAMSSLRQSYDTAISGSGSDVTADLVAVDRADGEVIRDKYHFILQHIQKLVTAAEENYMMVCKENWIKNQTSKINMAQANGPTSRAELERRLSENANEMMKQFGDFDNARMAIQWLQRHFDLLVTRRTLGREICHINMRIASIQKQAPSEDTLDELRHLRAKLNWAHNGVSNAVKQAQQLRRESLAVGLQYLDTNHSGSIEPDDQPQLSAELFSRLDVRNKHRITPADLQAAVEKMEKNIDNLNKNVYETEREVERLGEEREKLLSGVPGEVETEKRRVQAEEISVEIKKKQDGMAQIRSDREREEALLRDTYSMFQNAFVESLFDKLGGGRDKHRYEALSGDMDNIERNIKNLHIAADQGAKGLASSKLAASSPATSSRKSPFTFQGRKLGSSGSESSSSLPSTFGSLLSRSKATSGSASSSVMTSGSGSASSSSGTTGAGTSGKPDTYGSERDSGTSAAATMTSRKSDDDNMSKGTSSDKDKDIVGDDAASGTYQASGSSSGMTTGDSDATAHMAQQMNKDTNVNLNDNNQQALQQMQQQQQQGQQSLKSKPTQHDQQQQMAQQQRVGHVGSDDSAI